MNPVPITVFTPAYNRAHLLPRLFHTLKQQTNMDFEWLIIDDESSDHTETVVHQFIEEKTPFLIRYYKQKHGGKHRATNYAVTLAEGSYLFIVDSDDWLPEHAIEDLQGGYRKSREFQRFAVLPGKRLSLMENRSATVLSRKNS